MDPLYLYPDVLPVNAGSSVAALPVTVPLKKRVVESIASEPKRTVRAVRGFSDGLLLWKEFWAIGGNELLSQINAHERCTTPTSCWKLQHV